MTPDLLDRDLYEAFDDLARRLPDRTPTSVDDIRDRARRRRPRRLAMAVAATLAVVVAGVVTVGGLVRWLGDAGDPATPTVGQPYGPRLAEARLCFAPIETCADQPRDEGTAQVTDLLGAHPDAEVLDVVRDVAGSQGEEISVDGEPVRTATVVFRIRRTTVAEPLLRDLLTVRAVANVAIGTAREQPREQVGARDERRQTLGRVQVPVHGSDDRITFEAWEPRGGGLCYGTTRTSSCSGATLGSGLVGSMSGTGCTAAVAGPDVDLVRAGFTDGTRLEVATIPLDALLPGMHVAAACWADEPAGAAPGTAVMEAVGSNGQVVDRLPEGIRLPDAPG